MFESCYGFPSSLRDGGGGVVFSGSFFAHVYMDVLLMSWWRC